jgi:hypothetical protein
MQRDPLGQEVVARIRILTVRAKSLDVFSLCDTIVGPAEGGELQTAPLDGALE